VAFGNFLLMDFHKLFGKGLRLFHIPTGPETVFTAKSQNFRQCTQLLKTHSSLTEAIHFGNDVHPSVAPGRTHWMLCVGIVDAFRSESLVEFAGIRTLHKWLGFTGLVVTSMRTASISKWRSDTQLLVEYLEPIV
jgi:hypothetical protein